MSFLDLYKKRKEKIEKHTLPIVEPVVAQIEPVVITPIPEPIDNLMIEKKFISEQILQLQLEVQHLKDSKLTNEYNSFVSNYNEELKALQEVLLDISDRISKLE